MYYILYTSYIIYNTYIYDLNEIQEHICTTKIIIYISKDIIAFLIWFASVRVKYILLREKKYLVIILRM